MHASQGNDRFISHLSNESEESKHSSQCSRNIDRFIEGLKEERLLIDKVQETLPLPMSKRSVIDMQRKQPLSQRQPTSNGGNEPPLLAMKKPSPLILDSSLQSQANEEQDFFHQNSLLN